MKGVCLWYCTAHRRGRQLGDPSGAAVLAPPLGELVTRKRSGGSFGTSRGGAAAQRGYGKLRQGSRAAIGP